MRLVLVVSLLVLAGCKLEIPNFKIEGGDRTETVPVTLTCTAVAGGGLSVASGDTVSVLVSVVGTYGPFSSLELSGEFSGSAEVFRTYKNDGTSDKVVADSVVIKDGKGFEKSCPFQVTVRPVIGLSDLNCVLTSSSSLVVTNQNVDLTMTASGAEKPYTFGDLAHSGVTIAALEKRTDIHATARVAFGSSGFKTVSAKVTDARGSIAMCSAVVEVQSAPALPALPPCSVATAFNPSFLGESVIVTATHGYSIAMNLGPAVLVDLQSSWNAQMEIYGRVSDTQAEVAFYNSGLFSVVATMEYLLSGRRVQCSTLHSVYDGYWY